MKKLEWDEKLETGIELIDTQHRELIKRIDALDLAIYGGKAKVELVIMLEYLASYVEAHFNTEEEMMMKVNYPDFSSHYEEHKKFKQVYARILQEYKVKGADNYLAMELDREVRKWLEHHLMVTDAAYVPYCKGYKPGSGRRSPGIQDEGRSVSLRRIEVLPEILEIPDIMGCRVADLLQLLLRHRPNDPGRGAENH